jgi:chaperonin GroEL (HSP60 family)
MTRRYRLCSEPGEFAAILKYRMAHHLIWQRDVLEEMVDDVLCSVVEAVEKNEIIRGSNAPVLPFPQPEVLPFPEPHNFTARSKSV